MRRVKTAYVGRKRICGLEKITAAHLQVQKVVFVLLDRRSGP
jgi:hypothetical protein